MDATDNLQRAAKLAVTGIKDGGCNWTTSSSLFICYTNALCKYRNYSEMGRRMGSILKKIRKNYISCQGWISAAGSAELTVSNKLLFYQQKQCEHNPKLLQCGVFL